MKSELKATQVIVPMVTPFQGDQTIDREAVARMCQLFVSSGVSVFALGTTGEGDSVSQSQRDVLVQTVVEAVGKKVPVYAGLTGNSLADSIRDARVFADLGADYLVAKLPAYYPMDENQMVSYLEQLADAVSLPLYIYNIPATTHHSIPLSVVERLSHHPNIAGLKDSERDLDRLNEAIRLWGERDDFDFLIGWAAMSAYGLLKGANGIVPSTGNVSPELYVQMIDAVLAGDEKQAIALQERTDKISALYQKGRSLSYSIPALKILMLRRGLCGGEVLSPMLTMTGEEQKMYLQETESEWNNLMNE